MAAKKTDKKTGVSGKNAKAARTTKAKSAAAKAVDFNREIRRAVDTGKVIFGTKQGEKSLLTGKAKLMVIAANTPDLSRERFMHLAKIAGVPCISFEGSGLQLGGVCGKPFSILIMSVEDAGKSTLISAAGKAQS